MQISLRTALARASTSREAPRHLATRPATMPLRSAGDVRQASERKGGMRNFSGAVPCGSASHAFSTSRIHALQELPCASK
eukprot:7265745-Alexandrium_andersonii.AAC.1